MEWKEVKLGDICKIFGRIGFRGYTTNDLVPTSEDGAISLSPSNIVAGELNFDKCTYIKWDKYYESPEIMITPNDILIVKTGSSVGRTTIVRSVSHPMTLNPQLVVLKNVECNPIYLSYIIKGREFQGALHGIVVGSAIPTLSQKNLANIKIELPNLDYQNKVASILSSLDSKIETNNKINAKLEEMAQALFKSWFVDFEPFKDKGMVESEFGMIPEGWKVGKSGDFYSINIGKTPPRKEQEWFTSNKDANTWVSISDMGSCGLFISESSEYLTNEAVDKFNIVMVPKDTVLLSFKLTIGRVAIADCEMTTNEAIARFLLPKDYFMEYTYLMLKGYNYAALGSTSSIATAVNSKIIKAMNVLMPDDNTIKAFHGKVGSLFVRIRNLQQENLHLSHLRDTLLPKLMNGEINLDSL